MHSFILLTVHVFLQIYLFIYSIIYDRYDDDDDYDVALVGVIMITIII